MDLQYSQQTFRPYHDQNRNPEKPNNKKNERKHPESIGKILKNHQRQPLRVVCFTQHNFKRPEAQSSRKSSKKKQLENKYNKIVHQYQKKQNQLELQLSRLEKTADKHKPNRLTIAQFDQPKILAMSDHTFTFKKKVLKEEKEDCGEYKSQTLLNFISKMEKQIELEGQLRRWKTKINKRNQHYITTQLKHHTNDRMTIESEEFDPYIQVEEQQPDIIVSNLIKHDKICEDNWSINFVHRFTKLQMNQIFSKLDFDGRGSINLKILVREIGIISNKNYRDRDLFKIWRRITLNQNAKLVDFTNVFCV